MLVRVEQVHWQDVSLSSKSSKPSLCYDQTRSKYCDDAVLKNIDIKNIKWRLEGIESILKCFFKAQAFARDVRDCPICELLIELGDHIFGVYINGQGHQWDCKGT